MRLEKLPFAAGSAIKLAMFDLDNALIWNDPVIEPLYVTPCFCDC
jgi:hypothetical protein